MTIQEIYAQFMVGSDGFCDAVQTHCGYEISKTEIARIATKANSPDAFDKIWSNESFWTDDEN